jgi:predicted RecB family endonuclease
LIATTAFQALAVRQLAARSVTGLPLLVVDHPLGGERPEAIARRAQQAAELLASLLGRH